MKKNIASCLMIIMLLFLCSCGGTLNGNISNETKYKVGEMVSTDIIDFTLNSAEFALYAKGIETEYMQPTTDPQPLFVASTGHSFIAMTFTINNKDRGTLNVCDTFNGWKMKMTAKYNGNEYSLYGFDLNFKNNDMTLTWSAISRDGGTKFERYNSSNYLLHTGDTITVRTIGVIDIEPEKLTDPFELTIDVLNSEGNTESFTYTIGQ